VTDVHLVNGRAVVDSLLVEVAEVEDLALAAVQNAYAEEYPPVPGPVGLLVGRRAFVYVVGRTSDGRIFTGPFEEAWEVMVDAPVELSQDLGLLFEPASPVPGAFPVTVIGQDEEWTLDLVVVGPEEVVRIELVGMTNRDGGGSYSVTGVTADGLHILGLDAVLTVDGVAIESAEGRWLFRGRAPDPGVSVVASWNGLEASLE